MYESLPRPAARGEPLSDASRHVRSPRAVAAEDPPITESLCSIKVLPLSANWRPERLQQDPAV
jgi:hypothetical protein